MKYESNINSNDALEKKKKENETQLKEIKEKYSLDESKLNNEFTFLKEVPNEMGEFAINKSRIKTDIINLKNKIQQAQKEKNQHQKNPRYLSIKLTQVKFKDNMKALWLLHMGNYEGRN